MKTTNLITSAMATLFLAAACAAPVKEPERTGFLSDYSKLELIEDGRLSYASEKIRDYTTFIIEPVQILFQRNPENPAFSDKELEELKTFLVDCLSREFTKDDAYKVVTEPGPGVARLRSGLTEVDETIGVLNITIYTKITGLGLGGASAEGELIDSITGEQLGAVVRWGTGSRILQAGLTKTGDAKIAIKDWCKDVRKVLDKAHGK